jgi:hypothetical protein
MNRQFWVKAYKGEAGTWYGAAGQTIAIDCNHSIVGYFTMNTEGQIAPAAGATLDGGTDVAVPGTLIPQGTEFPNTPQPNLTLTDVVKIKDNAAQTAYYVDARDYATAKVQCNPVPYASACPAVTDLDGGTPTDTTTTVTWNEDPAITGVEYVNNTSAVAPTGAGTFLPVGTGAVTLTGLDTGTAFHFWIRTVCTGGVTSAWTSVTYSTTCALVTALSAGTPGALSATITWTENPSILGIEYVNNTSAVAPVGSGTFVAVGTETVALTGLITATTYHFWIRTSCADGGFSAWTSLVYTTA